jgi:threonine/homoserine/homoserine lactone efflux protein
MDASFFLLAAFALSLMGSLPFGMINLNVLSAAVHRGRGPALQMALGAVLIEGVQLILILTGFSYLADNPGFERTLRGFALPVFLGLALYYFLTRPKLETIGAPAASRPFLRGVGLSLINVLVYPFWLFWLAWLDFPVERHGLWSFFIGGAVLGAYVTMLLFILLGRLIQSRASEMTRHLNRIIAVIFLGLALLEGWRWFGE